MDEIMYSINNLRVMEVIDINTGAKIGFIRDFKIDCDNYKIESDTASNSKLVVW